ncbi:phosphoglycerate dehydrogenase-like enzyme [Nonomuraea polychroma]|uniref:Phosphoglycerate dehydrogenase-like enzyme n=1 Tax=Nonomuraea polychroma TaxID=46176 RepID=A0A438M4W6_9ACTN|nr:D-2-hydroxyacid dehydrogenase [Nonomuraea polychroma]RVX40884.1 phosphoglycerate dehydrogenase-like enzyme [Nonomuraea polychroma]
MSTTLVLLPPHDPATEDWQARLEREVPDLVVLRPGSREDVEHALAEADAAYGTLPADLLAHAGRLRWLQAPQAGPPPGFYHPALVAHPVQVTNMRDTYTGHVAAHTLALVLALARGLPRYVREQARARWAPDWDPGAVLPLGEATALVVGVGAVGAEVGRLLAAFGIRVVGVDARRGGPVPGFAEVLPADALDRLLPGADLVILTVPHTPATEGLLDARRLALAKPGAYVVNVGRGPTVRLDDLAAALSAGRLAGAALDVFETEPLPADHPLWRRPDVLITPHVAGVGPHADERRFAVLLENARRFVAGRELINLVDKSEWY